MSAQATLGLATLEQAVELGLLPEEFEKIKEIYSEDEILALYNFMSSEEGLSITNKQPLAMEKGMLVISEDLVKLQERLVITLQDPEVQKSLKKED